MTPTELASIHQTCGWLTATPLQIRSAAAAVGIQPHSVVNGVELYLLADVERIAERLALLRGFGAVPSFVPPIT